MLIILIKNLLMSDVGIKVLISRKLKSFVKADITNIKIC